jgi:hypothetical protein
MLGRTKGIALMSEWDAAALSRHFLQVAEAAESYVQEVRGKVRESPSYKVLHDEHLARFYVFNRLHGRTWLASRPVP